MANAQRKYMWKVPSTDLLSVFHGFEDVIASAAEEVPTLERDKYILWTSKGTSLFGIEDVQAALEPVGEPLQSLHVKFMPPHPPTSPISRIEIWGHQHVPNVVSMEVVIDGKNIHETYGFMEATKNRLEALVANRWSETDTASATTIQADSGGMKTPVKPEKSFKAPQIDLSDLPKIDLPAIADLTKPSPPRVAPAAPTPSARQGSPRDTRQPRAPGKVANLWKSLDSTVLRHPLWSALIAALTAGIIIFVLTLIFNNP